jgi:hypothetical protein
MSPNVGRTSSPDALKFWRSPIRAIDAECRYTEGGTPVAVGSIMARSRSVWVRVLQLYEIDDEGSDPALASIEDSLLDARVHARSRFRSVADHSRFALYSVHDTDGAAGLPSSPGEHTLIAVREFRRVPLDASTLGLTVFTAQPGRAVQVVAALAGFVERAVDLYQPGYLLLAHSLEQPRTSLLLAAVRDSAALSTAASSAFNLEALRAELDPLLATPLECYAHCPEAMPADLMGSVSPYAV